MTPRSGSTSGNAERRGQRLDLLSFLQRNWLWISVPAFLLSASLLTLSIAGVVRTVKEARLFDAPLLERQEIEFKAQGRVVLCAEGPFFSTRFARLEFGIDAPHGSEIRGRRSIFRARTSGFSKAGMELAYYEIPYPGRYVLRIRGLGEGERPDDRHRVVFMRPHLARSIAYVIAILPASAGSVLAIVLFSLGVARGEPVPPKVPLIVAAVIAVIVAALLLSARSSRKEDREIRELARSQGWSCALLSDDPERRVAKAGAKLEELSPEIDYDVSAVMDGGGLGPGVLLIAGRYQNRGTTSRNMWRFSACLIASDRFPQSGAQVDILPGTPSVLDNPFSEVRAVDMGGSPFSREFTVYSRDRVAAMSAVGGSLQAVFLENKGSILYDRREFVVSLVPGGAVLRMDGVASVEEWRAMTELARRIETAMR